MKRFAKAGIFLLFFASLIACSQAIQTTPSAIETAIPRQIPTIIVESTPTQPNPLSSSLPTISFPDETTVPFPTLNPKIPTLLPTISPSSLYEMLSQSLLLQKLNNRYGYDLQKITGWTYGLRQSSCGSYRWLNSSLLLLYPRSGEEMEPFGGRGDLSSQRVVMNLENGYLWHLPYEVAKVGKCDSARWSPETGMLIVPEFIDEQNVVTIYNTIGTEFIKRYPGKLIDVSPSGTKILIEGDTWIDLITGKIVDFAWFPEGISPFIYVPVTAWSSDESKVFTCCYNYGNAKTGKSQFFSYGNASDGTWVKNDSYVLLQYHNYWGSYPGHIPLYDPSTNNTVSLNTLAGIPTNSQCPETKVSPNGKYVWVMCYEKDYLVDLANFKSKDYPEYTQSAISWSADSNFAWITNFDLGVDNTREILSVATRELMSFPVFPTSKVSWHPIDHVMAYLTENNQVLTTLNAKDMTVKDLSLRLTFEDFDWSQDGSHIALLATDGSLWQVDYPEFKNLEQLTAPMSDVRDVFWSPDDSSIAFASESDIYIVETTK